MTFETRKRRTKAYIINQRSPLLLLLLVVGSISILVIFYHLSPRERPSPRERRPLAHRLPHADKPVSTPIFEEINAKNSRFIDEVEKIDHAIYESLYKGGIPEENILFLSVSPRHEKRNEWDFTQLWVKLPSADSALQVTKIIGDALSSAKPNVRVKIEKVSKDEKILHLYARGLYSHKIKMTWEDHQTTPRNGVPRIGIIIDDLGYDPFIFDGFLKLDLPLAFSILPQAPCTHAIAGKAGRMGRELILHLPMEPAEYPQVNPGPGALLTTMGDGRIRATIRRDLEEVPGVLGVNNHMGSLFTTKRLKMAVVMTELKKRNLFYVDSRTTTETVASELAEEMGVPVASRSVFLDNDLSSTVIKLQMERLLGIARHSGAAIGIGHPNVETLRLLRDYRDKLKTRVRVVPVSELIGHVPEVSKMHF
jgi:polysaccharide deacetylase 2 family uncharacterized protein YibQ